MDDLDRKIEEALNAEDREILSQFGEQGIFGQIGSLFQGKLGWISMITFIVATVMFVVGAWAAWKFYMANEVVTMLKWAGLAWLGLMTQIMIKLWSWMRMESNRVLREVKRLELQIARTQR
ncbi:hypothetical protein PUV54_04280 [Hyphococcus flavus]|uniref:Uncharacterized protein n=1 Tax=Hyphococcus flavus TaxID=1866326 RepID=A0AAF0CC28_9PROT|nr:DUF6768 family protein [Hyphococcus flavus]WDI32410.1 hypothetical protein PUV54_04280 [Hyphococcus flavus]